MGEELLTIRLTKEELRLLSDCFSMSFIHDGDDPDTAKLERISQKLSDASIKDREKNRRAPLDEPGPVDPGRRG